MSSVTQALDNFIQRTLTLTNDGLLESPFEDDWRSPCEVSNNQETSFWRPIPQTEPLDFGGLGNAADTTIHPDIQTYFGSYWSGSLQATTDEGYLSLIQLWNKDDFERLIENLVGHLFMKNRNKQPFTVFFATTERDSEFFLSIDNASGNILLEEPGKPPLRKIDQNIATFLNRLEPDLSPPNIY